MRWLIMFSVLVLLGAAALADMGSIINSKHNLSASGPGSIRATSEQEVCIFCHTPHHATPVQPLWNRNMPANAYKPYTSSSLVAAPGQPTGSSKLCLSCHDGTIAIGAVVSRAQPIAMTGGVGNLPPGPTNFGTDLSGDHPISFRYDSTLATKNTKLKDPAGLPTNVHLDPNHELQCTSCHDPHDSSKGKFLVMDNSQSQLCTTCHTMGTTDLIDHQNCNGCHQPHKSPSGPWLLKQAKVSDTCLSCHNGSGTPPQGPNVGPDMMKISMHETRPLADAPGAIPNTATCHNCHEPHTMRGTVTLAPTLPGRLGQIGGVTAAGSPIKPARYEYEVCFTCHGDQNATQPYISRKIAQSNTRLQFSSSAISYHPVEAAGKNATLVPSLRTGYTTGSIIYCHDCHSSDTSKLAGSTGANGTHGSNQKPLLIATYLTADRTPESATAYALCYRCHDRTSILNDQSFRKHHEHIVDQRTPCSVCHDGHGISQTQGTTLNNAHLINFDNTVVRPTTGGLMEYRAGTAGHGSCSLVCHGKTHNNLSY